MPLCHFKFGWALYSHVGSLGISPGAGPLRQCRVALTMVFGMAIGMRWVYNSPC